VSTLGTNSRPPYTDPLLPDPDEPAEVVRAKRTAFLVVFGVVVLGIVGIVLLVVAFGSVFGPGSPRSDSAMIARFQEHRRDYQELLRIFQTHKLGVFSVDAGGGGGELSTAEAERYLQRMKELGVESVERFGGQIQFTTDSDGLVSSGWIRGYLWASRPPSPLVGDTQKDATAGSGQIYRHIEGDWYVTYEWS
jgi:hypothetical protein